MKPFPDELQPAFDAFNGGRIDEAAELCRNRLTSPNPPGELFFLLGLIANKTAHHAESVAWLERAAQAMPPSLRLFSALGGAYRAAGDLPRAMASFSRCLQIDPQCGEAGLQLGDLHYQLREMEQAAPLYRRAVELDPQNGAAWYKLANTLRNLGDSDAALAAYDRALALQPDNPRIHANRGRTLLAAGRLAEGFREFEFRWEPLGLRRYPQTVWQGEALPGKTLFVFAEQGMGDTIQFVRYLRFASERVGRLVLECQPPLQSLLEHSRCADSVIIAGEEPPPFDCYVPLLHLPSIFGTTLETIPAAGPYLTPPATVTLPATPAGNLKVGLAWAGNPRLLDDAIRSLPLSQLADVLKVSGISFFSLQLKIPARDESFFHAASLVNVMEPVQDFAATAAIISQLDLVISVDTAVAHLAGALGRPVWTLLPSSPDWRWMWQRTDTPWYPTMRLFRQPAAGDWQPVLAEVVVELTKLSEPCPPAHR